MGKYSAYVYKKAPREGRFCLVVKGFIYQSFLSIS